MIDKLLVIIGGLFAIYGLFGLIGAWVAPSLGQSRLYSQGMLTGSLKPTRANRTIIALVLLFGGCYFMLLNSSYPTLRYTALAVFVISAIVVAILQLRSAREA